MVIFVHIWTTGMLKTQRQGNYRLDLKTFCKKTEPFVLYYKRLIKSYNNTMHNILEKEINLLLPKIPRIQKHGIITTFVSSFFIGLAYEGISSFLHNR